MSFLDKAKKLAEQAAEKAGPLMDKAAPHAQDVADKAAQQVDKRTGGKYHDRIEATEARVGELADQRMADGDARAGADTVDPSAATAGVPVQRAPVPDPPAQPEPDSWPAALAFPARSVGRVDGRPVAFGAETPSGASSQPASGSGTPSDAKAPAQPDLAGGQPDDPAHTGTAFDPAVGRRQEEARGAEPDFSAPTAEPASPAPPPATTYPAEPDSATGQPDDPDHSPAPAGTESPGLSEGPAGTPTDEEDWAGPTP